jgi:hypothetical protein
MKIGDKVKINKDMPNIDGMLHKDTIVKVDDIREDGILRVVDLIGKIWWVNLSDVSVIDT